MLAITCELGWGLKTKWETSVDTGAENVSVRHQLQVSLGVGMDF